MLAAGMATTTDRPQTSTPASGDPEAEAGGSSLPSVSLPARRPARERPTDCTCRVVRVYVVVRIGRRYAADSTKHSALTTVSGEPARRGRAARPALAASQSFAHTGGTARS